MSPELSKKILEKFSDQFKSSKKFYCQDGWFKLLYNLCEIIDYRISQKPEIKSTFTWTQIKEKFGGLRAYYDGGDEFISGAVRLAELMSYSTCEVTGNAGKLRNKKLGDDGNSIRLCWVSTLCDEEATKEGYILE